MTTPLPAYLQNRPSRGLAQTLGANLGVGSPPFLSIIGNRLTLIDAAGEEIPVTTYSPQIGPYLDCVIIDALERTSKIYYDKPFDPSATQYEPPACFSDNGVAPSRNASKPQARTCAECQWSAWGSKTSAVSGKGVKACADIQKIALLVPGFEMPFLLRVPPNSRTNFRGYVNKFVGQPVDIADVTTRISFEPGVLGTLKFEGVGWLDEQTILPQRDKFIAAHATDSMVGRTDMPIAAAALGALQTPASPPASPQASALMPPPLGNPAPFVPKAAPPGMPPAPAFGMPTPAQPQPAQPAPAPASGRRRRQTAAQPALSAPPTQAPFMQPAPAPAPAPAPGFAPNFGMANAPAPNAEIQNTLEGLFGKLPQ